MWNENRKVNVYSYSAWKRQHKFRREVKDKASFLKSFWENRMLRHISFFQSVFILYIYTPSEDWKVMQKRLLKNGNTGAYLDYKLSLEALIASL